MLDPRFIRDNIDLVREGLNKRKRILILISSCCWIRREGNISPKQNS